MDGSKAWLDVALHRPQALVPGLGHDHAGGDVGLAEVGGRGVPELVQLQAVGVVGEQDTGAVVAQPDAAGLRADVTRVGDGQAVRTGPVPGQEQRPAFAPGDQAR